jgi:hypothetical protein
MIRFASVDDRTTAATSARIRNPIAPTPPESAAADY